MQPTHRWTIIQDENGRYVETFLMRVSDFTKEIVREGVTYHFVETNMMGTTYYRKLTDDKHP